MASREQVSIALLEHDRNDDIICVWSYPGVSSAIQTLCVEKCNQDGKNIPYLYFKIKSDWVYVLTVQAHRDVTPEVNHISLCLVSKIFNPEKYKAFLAILIEQYVSTGDPTKILEGYLSIYATGRFAKGQLSFDLAAHQDSNALLAVSVIKDISRMLGLEAVVLWNAILLKKRILVVSDSIPTLLEILRTLPQLVWHRQDWHVLRPLISSAPEHMEDLSSAGVFIAGTTDTTLASKMDSMFDVVFSVTDRRVAVSEGASADMKMGSIHREIAQIFTELEAKASATDQDVLKAVAVKTDKVIRHLHTLAGDGKLTEEVIAANVANETMRHWLCRLAIAEGLL